MLGNRPLRPIPDLVSDALARLSPEFEAIYSHAGRPGIPAERLLRALLLDAVCLPKMQSIMLRCLSRRRSQDDRGKRAASQAAIDEALTDTHI